MTQHDPTIRIRHMRDHAQEAIDMLGAQTVAQLQGDRMLQLELVQLIEIVEKRRHKCPANCAQSIRRFLGNLRRACGIN